MSGNDAERVSVDLTPDEATLIIAALRQFEPYWPSEIADLTREDMLAAIRVAIDRVTTSLKAESPTPR